MSLEGFQRSHSPNVIISLFRSEMGSFGVSGKFGAHSTSTANSSIILRQLYKSRAPRNLKDFDTRIETMHWPSPEKSHVIVLMDKVFIRNGNQDKDPYRCYILEPRVSFKTDLRLMYSIPTSKNWVAWEVWLGGNSQEILEQKPLLFVIEKPGNKLQAFFFETGKPYKTFCIDMDIQFHTMELTGDLLELQCVKLSVAQRYPDAKDDFIVLECPKMKLVSRCLINKTALGNSSRVEVHGEYMFIFYGHSVEICDMKMAMEPSGEAEADIGRELLDGSNNAIETTHLTKRKPTPLYIIPGVFQSYLSLGYAVWPPCYIKRALKDSFQVLPFSKSELKIIEGSDLLTLTDTTVSHDDDSLIMHPDGSGRLILTGQCEIRIIKVTATDTLEGRKLTFEIEFQKSLTEILLTPLEQTPRSRGRLRAVAPVRYCIDHGFAVLVGEYSPTADLYIILEASHESFKLHMYCNQTWAPLAEINLFDVTNGLSGKPCRKEHDFTQKNFILDVNNEFITIRRLPSGGSTRQVADLFIVSTLADKISYS